MKGKVAFFIFSRLLYLISLVCKWTQRCKSFGVENLERAKTLSPLGVCALAVWHENAMASLIHLQGIPVTAMTSRSRDGDFAAYLISKYGGLTPRGSSSRGGSEALELMLQDMQAGYNPTLTVDGPRGPRRQTKSGIVRIAVQAGLAIVPYAVIAEKSWVFNKSWDKTRLPKPFSRVVRCFGTPIMCSPDGDLKECQDAVTAGINRLEDQAQEHFKSW